MLGQKTARNVGQGDRGREQHKLGQGRTQQGGKSGTDGKFAVCRGDTTTTRRQAAVTPLGEGPLAGWPGRGPH